MPDPRTAYVLIQAANPGPGAATKVIAAGEEHYPTAPGTGRRCDIVTPTIGAYDTVAVVTAPTPEALASMVASLEELDEVGRTLTLFALEETEDPEVSS